MRTSLRFFGALWLVFASSGIAFLAYYENKAGAQMEAPARWPSESAIRRSQKRPTLVMFAHPRCPCTRASINELAVLMTDCQNKLAATVLFFQPENSSPDWSHTDLWRSASAIPGVSVRLDVGGKEAKRFNATTSGDVVLFDASGRLKFSGGITASRGHEGDNDGRDALTNILLRDKTIGARTPVFGCLINDPQPACAATNDFRIP